MFYKIKGDIKEIVYDRYTGKIMAQFDENGEYVTEDKEIIQRLQKSGHAVENIGDAGEWKCEQCGMVFSHKIKLTRHINAKHIQMNKENK